MTVEKLKACCPPDVVCQLDAMAFDWTRFLAVFQTILPLLPAILALFAKPAPAPTPTAPTQL